MKIEVTQKHIDLGERESSCSCPVALSLSDLGWARPIVCWFAQDLGAQGVKKHIRISLPEYVREWIDAFDRGCLVEPFEFELDA